MKKPKLYMHFDVEADGECPDTSNMLSLGISGAVADGTEVYTYLQNITPRDDRAPGERCMREFWDKNPVAWAAVTKDQVTPACAMALLAFDVARLRETYRLTWVASPAAFDWQWLKAYWESFGPVDKPYLGYYAKCLTTMWWAYRTQYNWSKDEIAARWHSLVGGDVELTHIPLDDARQQSKAWFSLCRLWKKHM